VSRPGGNRAALLSRPQQLDLAELLDRTLGAGVVVAGDVTLSVAEVELVYLNLRALLSSVATLEAQGVAFPAHGGAGVDHGPGRIAEAEADAPPTRAYEERSTGPVRRPIQAQPLTQSARAHEREPGDTRDDERLERGLAQLVLTVVELLRKLMERQALRRVDAGTLEPERVERLGRAFERLEQQMSELKQQFELADDDLTLRLGPLPGLESEDAR
jgi:hypothetical protein